MHVYFVWKKSVQKYQCHTWDSLCQTPGQDWKSPQGQTAVNKKNKMQIQIIYNNTLDLELPLTIIKLRMPTPKEQGMLSYALTIYIH